ncbi:hypothetical protein [Stenotrophomonas sp.]|uniref:hypothetical protein n=1 Tax=Stenotrophomonas sp. TaxID=69392 RepID=UPI00289AAB71|nr:hypothetical protein [Stenotrophomonas sp.]
MPAPDLTVKVPGETADNAAATGAAPQEAIDLSKQTVVVIAEALPGLTAGVLIALRDLEVAGSNRKGVIEAIEAEDARRAALAVASADAAADAEDNAAAILVPDYVYPADANRLYGEAYGVDWVYEGGAHVPLQGNTTSAAADVAAASQPRTAGQAVLTDAGWVVPEPPQKG